MICPNCQTDTFISEQQYGALYTCNSCQAVYFINFDGKPEFSETVEPAFEQPAAQPIEQTFEQPVEQPIEQPTEYNQTFESSLEPLIDSVDMVNFDAKLDEQFGNQLGNPLESASVESPVETQAEPEPQFANSPEPSSEPQSLDYLNDINPFEQAAPEAAKTSPFNDVAKEISEFGNTETQLSGLNYDLHVSGLDNQETMKLFKEAISDLKLGWDANEIFRTVKNGQIKLEKLSPVKAYIIAKRIQFMDIEKNWKQNGL